MSETNSNDPCRSAHELTAQESRRLSELEEKIHRSDIEKDEYNSLIKKMTSSTDVEIPEEEIKVKYPSTVSTSEKIEHNPAPQNPRIIRLEELNGNSLTDRPMKFHKFIVYFSLPVSALRSLGDGTRFLTGSQYIDEGFTPNQFFAAYPAVKSLDMIFGGVCLVQAVYCFYVCRRLARHKENGPDHLKALAILAILTNLAYLLLVSSAIKLPIERFINTQTLASVFVAAFYLVIIFVYYDKRKAMFINM